MIESNSINSLSDKFHLICSHQPNSLNHGWKVILPRPANSKRYFFHLNSGAAINEEVFYSLSILLHQEAEVISESTNSLSDLQPIPTVVLTIDSGLKKFGQNQPFEEFESQLKNATITHLEGFSTITFSDKKELETLRVQNEIKNFINHHKGIILLNTFINWQN